MRLNSLTVEARRRSSSMSACRCIVSVVLRCRRSSLPLGALLCRLPLRLPAVDSAFIVPVGMRGGSCCCRGRPDSMGRTMKEGLGGSLARVAMVDRLHVSSEGAKRLSKSERVMSMMEARWLLLPRSWGWCCCVAAMATDGEGVGRAVEARRFMASGVVRRRR